MPLLQSQKVRGQTTTTTIVLWHSGFCPGHPGTRARWYQKKHSRTHTYRGHQSAFICFLHLHVLWSMASSLFNLRACQSFCTTSVQVFFGIPLGLAPATSYSIYFFTQSLSSFCSTCPCHRSLFRCSTEIIAKQVATVWAYVLRK